MSIMDIFRNKPQAPAVPAPGSPSVAANPTVPSEASPVQPADGTKSPVDKYKDLWKPDDGANQPADSSSLIPNLNMDPAKLREAASKIDFTGHIAKEDLQKASSGDPDALARVVNQAVQLGFAQSAAASGEISKQHFTAAQGTLEGRILPQAMRQSQIDQALAKDAVFQDPTVAPMVGMMKQQFARKYPTASPEEIASMAKEYLAEFATKVNGGSAPGAQTSQKQGVARQETDWNEFFSLATGQ